MRTRRLPLGPAVTPVSPYDTVLAAGARSLILLFAILCLAAQDDRESLHRQIDQERKAGRMAYTEPLVEQWLALEQRDSGDTSEKLIPILDQLAKVAMAGGRFDRAGELYQRSLSIVEAAQGPSSPALIPVLGATVRMHQIAGDYPAAEGLLLRAISIRIASTGPQTAEIASDYLSLARVYAAQAKFSQAAGVYSWALEILEKLFGLDDARVLPALDGIASAAREGHDPEKALTALSRAEPIREVTAGPMHPDLAQTLDNMGAAYFALKRYDEAGRVYERSLQIWVRQLGARHPMVATSLDNLAVVYAAQNRFVRAEETYREALAIRDSEDVSSLRNLALVLTAQQKFSAAAPLFLRAMQLLTAAPSPLLVTTLNDYADMLEHLRRNVEARRWRARAVLTEKMLGKAKAGTPQPVPR